MSKTLENMKEETEQTKSGHKGGKPAKRFARLSWLTPRTFVALCAVLALIVTFGARYVMYSRSHASTDDAYIASDVTLIAPQVSGTVKQVLVNDNQYVKKGDLLAVLDDSTYRAAEDQAQANLTVALAQAETGTSGGDQVASNIAAARADVARSQAGISTAFATAKGAEASIGTAQANVSAAIANKQRSRDAIDATQASVDAARATYNQVARDSARYKQLYARGAISAQAADQANSAVLTAKAALLGKEAELRATQQQYGAADAAISQARSQFAAAQEQASAARAGIQQAQAQFAAAQQGVRGAQSQHGQSLGRVDQARAALEAAQLQLGDTRIYAPSDGLVSKKNVQVGSLVQPGSPLMALVNDDQLWIVANFKETQLNGMRPGEPAEFRVDAFPGRAFKCRVDSIASATGSTFALLPADNATGNFTKVVQRVPVKIVFDKGQPGLDVLRAGLSGVVTVRTK